MDNTTNRIIGDFFEINSNILQFQLEKTNKIVSYYRKIRGNQKRKKLLKVVKKLRESDHILNIHNIAELLTSCFNNFPPKGEYKSIVYSKINPEDPNIIEGIVRYGKLEDYTQIIIKINLSESICDLNIHTMDYNEEKNFYIQLSKLETDNPKLKDIIQEINKLLLNIMCSYIEEVISKYL